MKTCYRLFLVGLLSFSVHLFCFGHDTKQSSSIDTTQIEVTFKSGVYTLHGKLILPKSEEKVPAVVFLVGSGGESSYRTNYKEWCEENLEKLLLPKGIAILYFDKRGVSPSEGKWFNTDFYDRAADAKAALDFLKQHESIDSTRLGVIGHGHGAWVAQLVNSRYPQSLAFGVSLAGAPFGVKKQLVSDYWGELLCKQIDPTEAKKMAERKAQATLKLSLVPTNDIQRLLKLTKDFDPGPEIRNMQNPFLFLFAENDAVVNPEWSVNELHSLFPQGIPHHIEYQIVPEANHCFRRAPFCFDESWDDMPYSEEYQHALMNWLLLQFNMHLQQAEAKAN